MSFQHIKFLPLLVLVFFLVAVYIIKYEAKAYLWVERYWFYKRTRLSKIALILSLLAIFVFLLALMDLRGPSLSKKASIPDQKTIVIIDSSASMLAEDIRPNRFLKSLLMARHFVKSAYGHQIAVVLFSDFQKRIIPFTDDMELLDARIESLEKKIISKGASNIAQAISESVQYFKEASKSKDDPTGNILLFTDSDENRVKFDVHVPDGITLGVVAVATRSGAPIPVKDGRGAFLGYKNYNGQKVVSKLDESFLLQLKDSVKNYKYWEVTTYNLPTDEVLAFFNKVFKNKISERNIDIRPVFTQYVIIVGIILYVISVFLSRGRNLTLLYVLIVLPIFSTFGSESKKLMEKFKSAKLNRSEILKLAEELLKEKKAKEAVTLYEENGPLQKLETTINYATALLASGDFKRGIVKYRELMDMVEASTLTKKESLLNLLRNNVLMALKDQEKKNEEEKKKDQQENSADKKQNNEDNSQENGAKDSQKKQNPENSGQKNGDQQKEQDPLKDKQEKIKQSREKNKIPAMLKQILDDDRKLQQIYLDTSTQKRGQNEETKDW